MNNNNIPIPNNAPVPSKKGKLAFIIILFIILLIIIVLVIKTTLNKQRMQNRLVKNTFFTEMNFNVTPYSAWCLIKKIDYTFLGELPSCNPICIRGKQFTNGIPQNITHIEGSYSLMFWFKIKKELFNPSDEPLNLDYPLVYFSDSNIIPTQGSNTPFLGFFIKPINNTMSLQDGNSQDDNPISNIYNLPYDKWVCVTSVFNNNTIDIYINGRLLKTSVVPTLSNYNILNLKWGPYPGDLAFVEINNDLDELNAQSVYKNYKYYYGIIDKYENSIDKNILLNTPFLKSQFKQPTQWNIFKGDTGSRTYNSVCY